MRRQFQQNGLVLTTDGNGKLRTEMLIHSNITTFRKKVTFFIGLFFIACFAVNAEDFSAQYAKLRAKEKTLLHECLSIYKTNAVSFFIFSEQPVQSLSSDPSINAWSALDVAQWKSKFGLEIGTVLTIIIDSKNRFGETTKKRKICGWSKGDYEMQFPAYLNDIYGEPVFIEPPDNALR